MKFYLQTLQPDEFMEVNQAVSLAGVYTEPVDFTRSEANVNQTLSALLEVMSEEQTIFVYGISNGFRNMLEEGRHLQKFSKQLIPAVPADGQGCMAIKAGSHQHLGMAAGRIFSPEQAALAMHNGAKTLLLDLEKIGRFTSAKKVLKKVLKLSGNDESQAGSEILAICTSLEEMRMAMACGATSIAAPKAVYDQMLFSVLTASETAAARDEWIMTYTRTEVLDSTQA
ncbi:hypothetical protein [Allobaculum mucilyticum]|uniref:hypothetical protein n=1 Tax=Allobaculum mucilyticum TaxID=2834459 RepID=UPI001E63EF83|nr:hypothetical protein [Allobaculum mucilyticum]UNT96793.1 hypothetical protein KWG62_03275 [Allobaculum mucilyticum]